MLYWGTLSFALAMLRVNYPSIQLARHFTVS
ncbi:MAG: hypothetical protein ACI9B9_001535 [Halioglobus sp.]|jgi:hypothetical protein